MIKSVKDVSKEALKKLAAYQRGEFTPVVTGRAWLDEVFGGLLPGDVITIAGQSGGGKSFEEQRIKNFIMDVDNNASSANSVWLSYSLEMRFLSTMLRDLNQKTKKSKKKILTESFSEEEVEMLSKYKRTLQDGRFFINEEVITVNQFKEMTIAFCEEHKDKENIFISLDHIALFKGGDDKKAIVDAIVEVINEVRKVYTNTYWFILSQLNRNILGRIKEKDMMAMPTRGDIFQSDTMFFISDYVYVSHNPYRLGMKEFLKVNAEVYDYISEHFSEVKNGRASFETLGKIFYIVLKSRESDVIFNDIFIENIEIKNKEKYKPVLTFDSSAEDGAMPSFDATISAPQTTTFNTSALQSAKGGDFEDTPPF